MRYIRWNIGDPEPTEDQTVEVDALDCSWRLPWKTVREDALSGLAVVYISEENWNANSERASRFPANDRN